MASATIGSSSPTSSSSSSSTVGQTSGSGGGGSSIMGMVNGVKAAVTELASHVQEKAAQVQADIERTRSATADLQQQVEQHTRTMAQLMDQSKERTDRALGDLKFYIAQYKGPFAEELHLQLDLLETGGQRLDQFIGKVGQWKVTTADGVQTIRDLLEGLDTRGYESQIQDLVQKLHSGAASLDDALAMLQARGGKLTESIAKAIEAYKKGELSIKVLLDLLRQAQQANPNDALGDLYGQIQQTLEGNGFP